MPEKSLPIEAVVLMWMSGATLLGVVVWLAVRPLIKIFGKGKHRK